MATVAGDDRWYFNRETLRESPSRKFGIDEDKELSYRQQAANLIQDMGQSLPVNQLCMNTAIVYMHRFYVFHSFTKFKWSDMAACCLFLAAKVEEQPRKLEHVIRVQHTCLHRENPALDPQSTAYLETAQKLVINENILLQTLGFDIGIEQPNSHVVNCCELVRASRDLAQTSYFMANESLHLTTMCLQHKPTVVACVCIHLACKWGKWELPNSSQGKPWFWYVDKSVTVELLEELTSEFLSILEKSPNRFRRKLMNARKEAMGDYSGSSKKDGHHDKHGAASPMIRAIKQNSPANHKKRIMPTEDKNIPPVGNAPHPPANSIDSRPPKKQKMEAAAHPSLSFDEWKERKEKEKRLQQHQQQQQHHHNQKNKIPPSGSSSNSGNHKQAVPDKARYHHHHHHHHDKHMRHEQKPSSHHRDRQYMDKNKHQMPPGQSKDRINSDHYQMMKHLNQNLGSGDREARVPHHEPPKVKEERPVDSNNINNARSFMPSSDRKHEAPPRVPAPHPMEDYKKKQIAHDSLHVNHSQSVNPDMKKSSPARTDNKIPSNETNASDKLFDDLISASAHKSTSNDPLVKNMPSMHDLIRKDFENSSYLNAPHPSIPSFKPANIDSEPKTLVTDMNPTNGDRLPNSAQVPERVNQQRRNSMTNSQKTPPSDCRRSSRHKTPPVASPVENKILSPVKSQSNSADILHDNLQPIVKIMRMDMANSSENPHDAVQDMKNIPKIPNDFSNTNLLNTEYKSPEVHFAQTAAEVPKPVLNNMPDRNLDPEPMDIVPITKHKDKSRKERHEKRKSSKKEKHRHKHSHSDSHRERNHGIKISISRDKLGKSDDKQRGSPADGGGGSFKIKFSKGMLTSDVSSEVTNDNSNSAVPSSGGGLKLIIPKSKLMKSVDNENPSREHRRRDKSPRSQHSKSPKNAANAQMNAAAVSQANFNQQSNPYFMPPVSSINQPMESSYAHAKQYCPAPAAIHPATVTNVRPPSYPGYNMHGSSYQKQPPLPPGPPPPPPPPPSK